MIATRPVTCNHWHKCGYIGAATSTLTLQSSHNMADLRDSLFNDAEKLLHATPFGHMDL
jgi:hypothetical protein